VPIARAVVEAKMVTKDRVKLLAAIEEMSAS